MNASIVHLENPRLSRARLQLMLRHPYFASAIARLRVWVTREAWCKTMATDGFNVYAGLKFLETTPEEELIGVLAHEVVHVVFGHIERRGNREQETWNIAIDFATNGFLVELGFRLPAYALLEPKYRGMTAEDIYDELNKSGRRVMKLSGQEADAPLDWHIDSGSLEGAWARGLEYPTDAELRRLREVWCGDLRTKLPGNIRGDMSEEIRRAGQSAVDWKMLLHHFTSGLRRDDYRLYPFNKRHLWRDLYMPSVGVPGPSHIIVAVDTSGSMDKALLASVLAEIDELRSGLQSRLTIMECDVSIQSVRTFESWELADLALDNWRFHGRGGTSFLPPFEWIQSLEDEFLNAPDALIYLTDGYGKFPEKAPHFPVLWGMVGRSKAKPPFGVRLDIQ